MSNSKSLTLVGKFGLHYTITQANMVIIENTHKVPVAAEQIPIEDVLMIADRLRHREPGDFWADEYMKHGY